MLLGWLNIYAAVYDETTTEGFTLASRYGSPLIWIGVVRADRHRHHAHRRHLLPHDRLPVLCADPAGAGRHPLHRHRSERRPVVAASGRLLGPARRIRQVRYCAGAGPLHECLLLLHERLAQPADCPAAPRRADGHHHAPERHRFRHRVRLVSDGLLSRGTQRLDLCGHRHGDFPLCLLLPVDSGHAPGSHTDPLHAHRTHPERCLAA